MKRQDATPLPGRVNLAFPRHGRVALFIAAFLLYLVSTSREDTWADARPLWDVAESIVYHGRVNISTRWPPDLPLGADGKIYAASPLLPSLVQIPGAALKRALTRLFPEGAGDAKPLFARLAPAALAALTCVMFFGLAERLGASVLASAIGTLMLALGTTLWVYARSPYSEALQAFCFTGFFGQLWRSSEQPTRRHALLLGLWAGLLVSAKYNYALMVPGAGLFLLWTLRSRWRDLARVAAYASVALAPFLMAILVYNQVRWGAPLTSGYRVMSVPIFQGKIVFGLWGLFLSPGKSVFLYSPPLLLLLPAVGVVWRRRPTLAWAIIATTVPSILLFAALPYWAGDYAWGPRYLVFAVPVLLLPVCLWIDEALALPAGWDQRTKLTAMGVLFLLGLGVQGLGNAFHWDHWIRLAKDARAEWLGTANISGVYTPMSDSRSERNCGACFEDMHPIQWLPPFAPIPGHWWLLRHVAQQHDAVTAEADGPWRRYTRLRINITAAYGRARFDWWFLDYPGNKRAVGLGLLTMMIFGLLVAGRSFAACVLAARGSRAPSSASTA